MRLKSALFHDYPTALDGEVFGKGRYDRIASLTDLYPHIINAANFDSHAANISGTEVIFATWGIPRFDERHFAAMPKLKAVFYAAGNVKAFAQPLLDRGVILVSGWDANAIPASEMCLSQVLLSLRGYFRTTRQYRVLKTHDVRSFPRSGINGETVGIIGLGKIGTRLRTLLGHFPLNVIAYDPFLTPERAAALGVEPVALDELFRRAMVVSNHTPDLESTQGVLNGSHFSALRDGATFINSGRGRQVVEEDLVRVLRQRPDLTALVDVTWPEPPDEHSPLWDLDNLVISPHIGGTTGDEVIRLADCVIEDFERWHRRQPLHHQVTPEVLATMG